MWLDAKIPLKPTYNSPITGDVGGPEHDRTKNPDRKAGQPPVTDMHNVLLHLNHPPPPLCVRCAQQEVRASGWHYCVESVDFSRERKAISA